MASYSKFPMLMLLYRFDTNRVGKFKGNVFDSSHDVDNKKQMIWSYNHHMEKCNAICKDTLDSSLVYSDINLKAGFTLHCFVFMWILDSPGAE